MTTVPRRPSNCDCTGGLGTFAAGERAARLLVRPSPDAPGQEAALRSCFLPGAPSVTSQKQLIPAIDRWALPGSGLGAEDTSLSKTDNNPSFLGTHILGRWRQ